jgi:GntR family transcriptional regulator/MocR family aminotransferase
LGYMVIPFDLLKHFEAALSLTVRHAPLLEQMVLTDFIAEGHFGRHLRRMREIYAERLSVLLDESRMRLRGLLEMSNIEAGLQTIGRLCAGIDSKAVAVAAAQRDVDVTPVSIYAHGRTAETALQLGFAAVDTKEIRRGVRELAAVLEGELKTMQRGPHGSSGADMSNAIKVSPESPPGE